MLALGALAGLVLALLATRELRTSALQAHYLSRWAAKLTFRVEPGPGTPIRFPQAGPYDERLGYTRIAEHVDRLAPLGFEVAAQARQSQALLDYTQNGFFPPYQEKTQAGLQLLDCRRAPLLEQRHPQRIYGRFEAVPPLLVDTLSFIENRELLSALEPRHNPVVEPARLTRAVAERAIAMIDPDYPAAGGSTLATQIEKYRHSPEGRTASAADKLRQMTSASVRVYRDGEETLRARRRLVADYLDSVPLGAAAGHGEVHGVGDGLWAWWGTDFEAANQALRLPRDATGAQLQAQALALRQVLSLLIAQRRPSFYFGSGRERLAKLVDGYLRLLAEAGVITPALRDAALPLRPALRKGNGHPPVDDFSSRKAQSALRVQLASMLDTPRLYDIDRLDLTAQASIDADLQNAVTEQLRDLRSTGKAKAAGLVGPHLLERGDPAKLVYSFTLYERTADGNRVRVQADSLDQPFDINAGAKLELGSTAKLRTLVSYLEVISELHQKYAGLGADELRRVPVARRDRLTRWALDHLARTKDKGLQAMLDAAMQRRYSASPGELFFTGGGAHVFENYRREDDGRNPTVAEALQDSVNLAFIRLMRDIVYHHIARNPAAAQLEATGSPERAALLARFADREGSSFMRQFDRKYRGKRPAEILELLVSGARASPEGLAAVFRTLQPEAGLDEFERFLRARLPARAVPPAVIESRPGARRQRVTRPLAALYERHAPGRYSLADRGYLAGVHPLELWLAAWRSAHPDASLAQVLEASRQERQEAYAWLFQPRARGGQDTRIATLLELDAFAGIHRTWQRLGYPFDHLVPSYATAIGSSGDRPAALAELMGILVNDGLRYPAVRIEQLHFAAATPYETVLQRKPAPPERVLAPEVAATVRRALQQVVEQGTARRLRGALDLPDGTHVAVGGKTGTGDNRVNVHAAGGRLVGSRVINRTATFVFFIGTRHFGTVTAYVPGADAQAFRFTSALPVQLLKALAPLLQPVAAADQSSANAPASCAGGGPDQQPAAAFPGPAPGRAIPPWAMRAPAAPALLELDQAVEWVSRPLWPQ